MRYNKTIARLCERMNEKKGNYIILKVNTTYRLEKDGDTLRLYHYNNLVGGVRLDEKNRAILGSPISDSDVRSLNTMWKYYMVGRRAHLCRDGVHVESISECSDNAVVF